MVDGAEAPRIGCDNEFNITGLRSVRLDTTQDGVATLTVHADDGELLLIAGSGGEILRVIEAMHEATRRGIRAPLTSYDEAR